MSRPRLTLASVVLFSTAPVCAQAPVDFNRDIRPILADRCFVCHGPDAAQRKGGDKGSGGLRLDTLAGAEASYVSMRPAW